MADFLGAGPLLSEKTAPKTAVPEVVLLMEMPSGEDRAAALRSVGRLSRSGASVILPAWFGPMENAPEDDPRMTFVRAASAAGAAVVGAHGRAYQIGDLDFWKKIPLDTFALHVRVDGDDSSRPDALIDRPLESPAPLAAAAVALLRAAERTLTPAQVKERLRERGRQVVWTRVAFAREGGGTAERVIASRSLAAFDRRFGAGRGPEALERFAASTLDAGLLLGLPPMAGGEWSRSVLRAAEARRKATGKGVTVAILDHMFDAKDATAAGKWVKPGSVIDGLPVFDEDGSGHGTWMARDLLSVAPGAGVMPVRVCGPGHEGTAEDYAKGIDYAVANGARIVSLSHRPVDPAEQAVLDEAVDRASRAGATFVYIHYRGTRSDVVVPGPVEFAAYNEGRAMVYVIGTNFIDDESFPYTWGLSPTAPMVSGVAAMMLEVNPELTPAEVRAVLLGSGRDIGPGRRVLDAAQAVRTAAASTRKR
jgi:subtilisin family serine protease